MRRPSAVAPLVASAVLALVGVASPLATGASSARPAHVADSCPPAATVVLARDAVVRVYRPAAPTSAPTTVAACLLGHTGHLTLQHPPPCCHYGLHVSLRAFKLAGPIVGYIETQYGVDSGSSSLTIADVASRRVLRSIAVGHYVDAGLIFAENVADFLVTSRGSIAWMVTRAEHGTLTNSSVHIARRGSPAATLEEAPDIEPRSLHLADGSLSWSRGGTRHTAPLR